MKAGLNPAVPDEGFDGRPEPTAEGGGRAGSEAGWFEEALFRPGGGG